MGDTNGIMMTGHARLVPQVQEYETLLDLSKSKAPDPSVFDEFSAAFWTARISSNRIDYYKTAMSENMLKRFVDGLNDGVSFQASHTAYKLGYGQSIVGEMVKSDDLVPDVDQPLIEVYGTFMTLSGVQTQEGNTNDFLAMIRSGGWKDVSVGFYATDITCSICGRDPMDWWSDDPCPHIPGVYYDDKGNPHATGGRNRQMAFIWINDGALMEVSQVYEGASPNAEINHVITKAEAMADQRMIRDQEVVAIERMYQHRVARPQGSSGTGIIIPGGVQGTTGTKNYGDGYSYTITGGTDMATRKRGINQDTEDQVAATQVDDLDIDDEDVVPVVPAVDDQADDQVADDQDDDLDTVDQADDDDTVIDFPDDDLDDDLDDPEDDDDGGAPVQAMARTAAYLDQDVLAAYAAKGIRIGGDPGRAIRALADALLDERARSLDNAEMAAVGRKQRDIAIDDAIKSGIRANGDAFNADRWRSMMAPMTYDQIKDVEATFEKTVRNTVGTQVPASIHLVDRDDAGDGEKPRRGVQSRRRYQG